MSDLAQQLDRRALLQNALRALEEIQAKLDAVERARTEPIAIIGMGCRFPGGANDPQTYWQLLRDGFDAIREVPAGRWDAVDYADPVSEMTGEAIAWHGGFLDQVDQFDAKFFGISPREAKLMDPQQRLVLEVSWEALEHAGLAPDKLNGSQAGMFLGITSNDYVQLTKLGDPSQLDVYTATGGALNVAAGRVAYTLGLHGPCMAVDTACSSSLVAVHLAVQSLRNGECTLALAGGVNVLLTPEPFICFSKWGMMAPDGRCKTFDAKADGFVRSEGCGVVVLKRLTDAIRDSDPILALIRGSAVNQDGRSSGLTVPNGPAQQAVIRAALANGRVEPSQVSYIEAHGTGTSLGDPIEVEAIGAVMGQGRSDDQLLTIGSVKTNIGHLESASGIAGLIKVVLALQYQEIPPHLHLHERSPRIPWPAFAIHIPTEPTPWRSQGSPRVAGVSSFGFSGTNAHVVLQEVPQSPSQDVDVTPAGIVERSHQLLCLSAKNERSLQELAQRFVQYMADQPSQALADICYTTHTGRSHFNHRLAVVGESVETVRARLAAFAAGQAEPGVMAGRVNATPSKVAWLFTGQGAQYVGMGRQLYDTQPVFRAALARCDELLRPHLEQPLLEVLFDGSAGRLDQTGYTQPALFALEYALAQLWLAWGVRPAALLGHSIGQYAAACIAGVFSLEDALALVATRARLMQKLPPGDMASVVADEATVAAALTPYADRVAIAALNAPDSTVISGATDAVGAVLNTLSGQGITARRLTVSHAFHSPLVEPMLDDFERAAARVRFEIPHLRLVSDHNGEVAGPEITRPDYWRRHTRQPVRFASAMQTIRALGCDVLLEVGPQPVLLGLGRRCWPHDEGLWLPSLRNGRPDWQQMLESLAALYTCGVEVDWSAYDRDCARHKRHLPTYPFQRERYWFNSDANRVRRAHTSRRQGSTQHPLLGAHLELAYSGGDRGGIPMHVWENVIDMNALPYLKDHQVQGMAVLPATAYIEMVTAAVRETSGAGLVDLSEIEYQKALLLTEGSAFIVQVVLARADADAYQFRVYSRSAEHADAGKSQKEWTLHATGTARHTRAEEASHATSPAELESIRMRCPEQIAGAHFYQKLAEKGNQWGLSFQGIDTVWRGDGEALGLVRVPQQIESELGRYQFHPAVADACGHVLVAIAPLERSSAAQGGAFVGGSIEQVRQYRPPRSTRLWVYARMRPDGNAHSNVLTGDVRVFDEDGALVSESLGAHLWYLDANERSGQATQVQVEDWFYELDWQLKLCPVNVDGANVSPNVRAGVWLILSDQMGVGEALAALLKVQGDHCVLVTAANRYEYLDEEHVCIRPDQADDIQNLLSNIVRAGQPPCHGIVHLWSLDAGLLDQAEPIEQQTRTLQLAQTLNGGSVLNLLRAVAQTNWAQVPHLYLVTQGAQPVGEQSVTAIAQTPLWGLGRTIALEHTELWGGLVDLDPDASSDEAAAALVTVLCQPDSEDQVAFRQGQRYVARLTPVTTTPVAHGDAGSANQLHADASYLITGGLGGLGLQVARWMAERGARHLILLGRSMLPPRSEWDRVPVEGNTAKQVAAVRGLESLGTTIYLDTADVADVSQMASFLERHRREGRPPIRGIVHAAGVVQHRALLECDMADLHAVMRAKVVGGWVLHRLLDDMLLDFFVLFSSASAVLSSPFLGGYAAANTFLDALAHYRQSRGKPAISINWGLWADVGMITQFNREGVAGLTLRGLGVIKPEQGLAALERLMGLDAAQVAVLPVDWRQWQQRYGAVAKAPLLERLAQKESTASRANGPSHLRETLLGAQPAERPLMLLRYLNEQAARVLGLSLSDLDAQQPLGELGLDSLMSVELKNRIEQELGIVVPVVTFLQGPSVAELAATMLNLLAAKPDIVLEQDGRAQEQQPVEVDDMAEVAHLLATLDQLSEEQIDSLLGGMLAAEESGR